MWSAAVMGVVAVVGLVIVLRRRRSITWRLNELRNRIDKLTKPNKTDAAAAKKLFDDIYALAYRGIVQKNVQLAYQALDLLKLAFGGGLAQANEHSRLQSLTIRATRMGQADVAGMVLDVYDIALRRASAATALEIVDQLLLLTLISFKAKQRLLVAKAIDNIFAAQKYLDLAQPQASATATRAMRMLGLIAIKKRDEALFREINQYLVAGSAATAAPAGHWQLVPSMLAWLHRIVRQDDPALYLCLQETWRQLLTQNLLTPQESRCLLRESQEIAGAACLNPYSPLAGMILASTLRQTLAQRDLALFLLSVDGASQVAQLALSRHGLQQGFSVIFPLLEIGRKLLTFELKLGTVDRLDDFGQRALAVLFKEYLTLVELAACQDISCIAGEIIADIAQCWQAYPDAVGGKKSIRKFCQLLFMYWVKVRRRQVKQAGNLRSEFAEQDLFVQSEHETLQFLLG